MQSDLPQSWGFEIEQQFAKSLSEAAHLIFKMSNQEMLNKPIRSRSKEKPTKTAKRGKPKKASLGQEASELNGSIETGGTDSVSRQSGTIPETGCFDCEEPHLVSSCSRKKPASLKSPAEREMEESLQQLGMKDREEDMPTGDALIEELAKETTEVGSISEFKPMRIFVLKANINGYGCEMLISTGATHNFLTPECAERLQLVTHPLENVSVRFALGSSTEVKHMAKDVMVQSGAWKGKVDFLIMPMLAFEAILGLDFGAKYVISLLFGRNGGKAMLDNLDGTGGVMVSLHPPSKKPTNAEENLPPYAFISVARVVFGT